MSYLAKLFFVGVGEGLAYSFIGGPRTKTKKLTQREPDRRHKSDWEKIKGLKVPS